MLSEAQFISELRKRDKTLAEMLEHRDSVAQLLDALPRRLDRDAIASSVLSHETWDLIGQFYATRKRLYEALALYWALYKHMLAAQTEKNVRLHKGMPLVRIADCYQALGFSVHTKRYLMLTLCEDALREHGKVDPDTTGIYFRLVWGHGLSHSEIGRYAKTFQFLADQYPDRASFPEALVQELDDDWITEFPTPQEVSHYRINNVYLEFLLSDLGRSSGRSLERIGHYLMSCMPGCRTTRRVRSSSTDYDLVCSVEGFEVDYQSLVAR